MGIYDRNYYQEEGLDLRPTWNQRSAISTLILINVGVYIVNMLFSGAGGGFGVRSQGRLNDLLTLYATDFAKPHMWWHLLSYGFVHDASNIGHLVFNMLGLYFLGRPVEQLYGRSEFYRIYLTAVVVCGLGWLVRNQIVPSSDAVLGASGAVICIEMLFVFNFPKQTVYLFIFPAPAWVLGILLVLANLTAQSGPGVAYDVHLFGVAFAALYFFGRLSFRFLGDIPGSFRKLMRRLTGPRLTVYSSDNQPAAKESADAAEADRILAKIHATGQDSLTSREKKFLEKYSKSVRNKKQSNP